MDVASSSGEEPRAFCWLCQEDQPLSRTIALTLCGHRYCVSCLSSHLTLQLLTGGKAPTCWCRLETNDSPCGAAIDEEDAMKLLAPDIGQLYLTRNRAGGDTNFGVKEYALQDSASSLVCRCGRREVHPLTALSSCGHCYCVPCLASLVTQSIVGGHRTWLCVFRASDGDAERRSWPHVLRACGSPISSEEIKALVCPYVWAKYQWLTWLKLNPERRIGGFTEFLTTSKLVPEAYLSSLASMVDESEEEPQPSNEDATLISRATSGDELDKSEEPEELQRDDEPITLEAAEGEVLDTFFCQVCLDTQPVFRKVELRSCGHSYCRDCIAQFLETRIRGGRVDFTCFSHIEGEGPSSSRYCAVPITSGDIEQVVSAPLWAKYMRFLLLQSNERARECPFCLTAQVTDATADDPQCVCSSCGEIFCLAHSNAHSATETCEEYEKRQPRLEKRSKVQVKKISKPCPGCRRPIERAGGCMHMTCAVCAANFCWLCREPWTNSYTHFDPFESTGCRYTYKYRIEAFNSDSRFVRGVAYALLWITMAIFGVPTAIVFTICRLFIGKTTSKAVAVMVVRAAGMFSTAFILRTAVVVGIVCGALFGCLGVLAKELCSRCFPRKHSKRAEPWLPLTTPPTS